MTPAPDQDERLAAFKDELTATGVSLPSHSRARVIASSGAVLMMTSIALLIYGYSVVHGSDNPLDQRDGIAIGLIGIGIATVGGALFVYGAMAEFLRFWMVRLGHQLRR